MFKKTKNQHKKKICKKKSRKNLKKKHGGTNVSASASSFSSYAYPNKGPPPNSNNIFNSGRMSIGGSNKQGGGNCNCGLKGGFNPFYKNPINLANVNDLPGVDGISGDRNHFPLNEYKTDVSRQIINVGPNPPFKGGKKNKKMKGGVLSNLMGQDFINFGRQAMFNLQSSYNTFQGYPDPKNPMPWKDQY